MSTKFHFHQVLIKVCNSDGQSVHFCQQKLWSQSLMHLRSREQATRTEFHEVIYNLLDSRNGLTAFFQLHKAWMTHTYTLLPPLSSSDGLTQTANNRRQTHWTVKKASKPSMVQVSGKWYRVEYSCCPRRSHHDPRLYSDMEAILTCTYHH